MNLRDAVNFTFENRESWNSGRGAGTARINANHVLRILGDEIQVQDIRTQHFTQLTQALKAEGKAPATINRISAALSTVLSELRCHGYDIPDVHYKRQREPKAPRPTFFTEEEIERLCVAAEGLTDYYLMHDAIRFASLTGCRQGEMLKLRDKDVDFDNLTITFTNTKTEDFRTVHMHADLVPILQRRVAVRIDRDLFPFRDKDQLLRAFKTVKAAAGLDPNDGRVWHSIRHSTATWLVERNAPLRAVMGVLGHSRVETTLRYAKASDRSVAAAIDLL